MTRRDQRNYQARQAAMDGRAYKTLAKKVVDQHFKPIELEEGYPFAGRNGYWTQ